MTRGRLLVLSLALLTTTLAGCIGTGDDPLTEQSILDDGVTYDTSRGFSVPNAPALYEVLPGYKAWAESYDGVEIGLGIFHPDIDGCDWSADEQREECQLPVVMDAGPYYLDAVHQDRVHPPTIEWLVPRGYHVVQMSLRGTGESGGCYEFKNPDDIQDVSAIIDHLAGQSWTNGNVGMIGRSYDGTGAWAGAASGNAHLKTILPISGAVDGPGLYYKNGTAEQRGFAQPTGYYLSAYGLAAGDPTYRVPAWLNTACPEIIDDWTKGPMAAATGDASDPYWQARDWTGDILENYEGSAWVVHGMQDWNVNPSQAVPFTKEMREAGIETRAWLGQWAHAFPDFPNEHPNVRWDFADQVLEWFDYYLKDEGEQPWLGVEVEDSLFNWRKEESFPPPDVNWTTFEFHGEPIAMDQPTTWTSEPLEQDLRLSGLPQLHLEAIPTTPTGGHVFAELYDRFPDGPSVRIGWGAINLQYHAGGNTDPAVLTPFDPVIAQMQFEPMDAHVGEGHQLHLVIHKDGVEDIVESPDPSPVLIGQSTLRLPAIERADTVEATGPSKAQPTLVPATPS